MKKTNYILFLSLTATLLLSGPLLPVSASAASNIPMQKYQYSSIDLEDQAQAQWHINYASYLIDVGKYFEALEQYDTAIDYSPVAKTRVHAMFGKAMVLSTFLDAPEKAADIYREIGKKYPKHSDTALYRLGFLYYQMNEFKRSRAIMQQYVKYYPVGRFKYQVEAVLSAMKDDVKPKPEVKPVPVGKEPDLRVCLSRRVTSMVVTVGTKVDEICAGELGCGKKYKVGVSGNKLVLDGKIVSATRIKFTSKVPLKVTYGKESKKVRGLVDVSIRKGKLLILNIVSMEEYLKSVVPAESYASWPKETLKAQAVAARTYAYYQKLHRTHLFYDVYADTYDQMYAGVDREDKRTNKAVKDTRGQILLYNKKPILAQYTANSGGYTADSKAIFGAGKKYLVAHKDPASLKGKMASWNRKYRVSTIESKLKKIGISVPGIISIKPLEKGPSGRITKVRIKYKGGQRDLRTRTTLGSSRVLSLPDILLKIEKVKDSYVFKGHGWGHGVGYSQWGGAEMGKTEKYDAILDFYYPSTSLKQLW
ncbi:MAG: SpoIID/LytB domain-containing protein [Desulfovibrio sp. S3730MH75]|nr:MAG: SpoIID/LytB domain-containing protein [Desulfovibrio sp. S3730MH75]